MKWPLVVLFLISSVAYGSTCTVSLKECGNIVDFPNAQKTVRIKAAKYL